MNSSKSDNQLYSYDEIVGEIKAISLKINQKIAGFEEVVFCPLMTGALVFSGHLFPQISHPQITLSYLHFSRYKNDQGSLNGDWLFKPSRDEVLNKHILIIDDILDEGVTLNEAKKCLLALGAKTVTTAVLFYKPNQKSNFSADFIGLSLPNEYVYGFGLDASGLFRNLPNLYIKNVKK
jgi:hypoxanthine phosphoribosyltransferase